MNSQPVILITGAGRGIGRATALALAAQGYHVAVNYVGNREAAEDTARCCREASAESGGEAITIQGDVGDAKHREGMMRAVLDHFGRIDGLVNNAGIAPKQRADILDASEESFEQLMRVNLQGPYFLTQRIARWWIREQPESRLPNGFTVIFITSISSDMASVNRGEYCVSKAGLSMAASLWAVRLAQLGILVYEIRPGIVATDMTAKVKEKYDALIQDGLIPQHRWGKPEDTGKAVASLMRGDFPYSPGSVIYTDGALHIPRL